MQDDSPPIESRGGDYMLRLSGTDRHYRVTVSREFLDEEVGDAASDDQRREWIRDHLAPILGAITARETGGVVSEPWGRLLVEEFD